MSLGHVYIVLKHVGSARLTFSEDRYYEFMCFDVPKVVRNPGVHQRHDEESRNVRAIKINILEGYIRTSERFRVTWVFFGVPGELREYGSTYGPERALREKEDKPQGVATCPPWA